MNAYLVDPEHIYVSLQATAHRSSGQQGVSWSSDQRCESGVAAMIRVAQEAGARGGEAMAETVVDSVVTEDGQTFELPDGFTVRALGTVDSWNGFPVPILGLVDALRVCLHVSEDADLYLCSPLPAGGFMADGLQWQQRSMLSA